MLACATALVAKLAADPRYHIAQVLDRAETQRRGGPSSAALTIAMEPGYETGHDPAAPLSAAPTYKGMHGYMPDLPAMRSTLIVAGPDIAKHGDLGEVDMRAIAPSVARILRVKLPSAKVAPAF